MRSVPSWPSWRSSRSYGPCGRCLLACLAVTRQRACNTQYLRVSTSLRACRSRRRPSDAVQRQPCAAGSLPCRLNQVRAGPECHARSICPQIPKPTFIHAPFPALVFLFPSPGDASMPGQPLKRTPGHHTLSRYCLPAPALSCAALPPPPLSSLWLLFRALVEALGAREAAPCTCTLCPWCFFLHALYSTRTVLLFFSTISKNAAMLVVRHRGGRGGHGRMALG